MKKVVLLFAIFVVLSFHFASASFAYKNNTLETVYTQGGTISGLVNISFQNQSAHSNFSSNIGGNISLVNLISESGYILGDEFTCTTSNCSEGYDTQEQITNININGKSYLGFRISGKSISRVGIAGTPNSIKFNLQSDISPSCYNQLLVDITGRETRYLFNNKSTGVLCTSDKSFGCFDYNLENESYQNSAIGTSKYCENITVRAAAAYRIGAKVTRRAEEYGNNATLQMALLDFQGNTLKSCSLGNLSQGSAELECDVNYGSPVQKDLLVCIFASAQNSVYQIRREQVGKICGTNSNNLNNLTIMDTEVFIRPLQSDGINIAVTNDAFVGLYSGTVGSYMMDYLRSNYPSNSAGNVNCEGGCVIPIGLYGASQTISFSNVYLSYYNDGDVSTQSIYSLNKSTGKLNSNFIDLDLSKAGFKIPFGSKPSKFILYLNSEKIFEKTINVSAGFDFDINPKTVLVGQSTKITAGNSSDIKNTIWDFGDGQVINSDGNSVNHIFDTMGFVSVDVTAIKQDGTESSKSFEIETSGGNESAWLLLKEYEKRVGDLKSQINSYPSWISDEIKKKIDIDSLNSSIYAARTNLAGAADDDAIMAVLRNLLTLDIPAGITKKTLGSFPLSVGYNNIDPKYIESLSGADSNESSSGSVKEAITKWMNSNYAGVVDFETIDSYNGKGGSSTILTKYTVTLNQNPDSEFIGDKYFVIDYPLSSIKFMQDYDAKEKMSGSYIVIKDSQSVFEFVIDSFVKVQDLGMHISPEASELDFDDDITPPEPQRFGWGKFLFYLILLIFVILIIYILLQEWYKRRYESYLFKQKNDIYNIITFIFNSRNNRLTDNEIRKKLSESGWNGEQIGYAMKKIDGKRTGMFEIPIFRVFEKKKMQEEIARRQNPSSVNFIKGPRL